MLLASIAFFVIPSGPGTARFLTDTQRKQAVSRLQTDDVAAGEYHRTTLRDVGDGLTSLPIVACAIGFFFGKYAPRISSKLNPQLMLRDIVHAPNHSPSFPPP
jgi:hypothetical protein